MTAPDPLPLPGFVDWPIFPFVGDMRVRDVMPRRDMEYPRDGEPGGRPCRRVRRTRHRLPLGRRRLARARPDSPSGAPVQVFLETREHVDLDTFDDDHAAAMGRMIVRLERAIEKVGDIARVHVNRWGDGGSHFHPGSTAGRSAIRR